MSSMSHTQQTIQKLKVSLGYNDSTLSTGSSNNLNQKVTTANRMYAFSFYILFTEELLKDLQEIKPSNLLVRQQLSRAKSAHIKQDLELAPHNLDMEKQEYHLEIVHTSKFKICVRIYYSNKITNKSSTMKKNASGSTAAVAGK